jgi:hypothetical protein
MTSPDRGGRFPTSRKGPSDDAEPLPPVSLKRDLLERVVAPLAMSLIAPVPEGVTCVSIFDAPTNDPVLARLPARKSNALRSFVHAALSAVDTKQVPTSKIKKKDRS